MEKICYNIFIEEQKIQNKEDSKSKMSKTAKITVNFPEEEKEKLKQYAEENDLTVSQVIRRACKDYLEAE